MDAPHPGTLTPEDFRRIREVFESALDRPIEERHAFVEGACGGDTLLVGEVERMLAAEGALHTLFDRDVPPGDTGHAVPLHEASAVCPGCQAAIASSDHFCRACGTPAIHSGLAQEGRFRAGALFGGRFRIVARLGRGGMGDVYRAHDVELGQAVALKFLTGFRSDERARARLRTEVRLARQISHPSVCRVYDIGEAHGDLYLSMEYVDGEDLAALLKRIGRVPIDKGIEIARRLCAGLAAAHAKGVLHRDFKPANIMIDGRGEVRIMDFGLAAIADQLEAADVRSGTPAYMAPEQLAGREATLQSDLYALGLVLYELFTGKPPFDAQDLQDLLRQRESHPNTTPSTLIPDLSPRVERAILRCLEPDPKLRPASALEVSASLPGGDPLAEALAAGETPSPEMVAAAGPAEGLRPRMAAALLALVAANLTAIVVLTPQTLIVSRLPLVHPPEELTLRARDIIHNLGYTQSPTDVDSAFRYEDGYVEYVERTMPGPRASRKERWDRVTAAAPWPLYFSFLQSPTPLIRSPFAILSSRSAVAPASAGAGLVAVEVDLEGRLLRLAASPDLSSITPTSHGNPDWSAVFRAAGQDITRFTSVNPQPRGLVADAWSAWTGTYGGANSVPVRVEAASFRGRVTSFALLFPWSIQDRAFGAPPETGTATRVAALVELAVFLGFALVARHQWQQGRGDPRGAWRLSVYVFVIAMIVNFLSSANALVALLDWPLPVYAGVFFAIAYLAVEPWARRLWPHVMITWARVVAGRWQDPVVGRDLLVAVTCVTFNYALQRAVQFVAIHMGAAPLAPLAAGAGGFGPHLDNLLGGRLMAAHLIAPLVGGLGASVEFFAVLFASYVVFRRKWLAAVVYLSFWVAVFGTPNLVQGDWMRAMQWIMEVSFLLFMTLRLGLFAAAAFSCLSMVIDWSILTSHLGAWYGQSSLVAVLMISAVALYAFRTSLSGRPLSSVDIVKA